MSEKLNELNDYHTDISSHVDYINRLVETQGVDKTFANQLHYLDCTRWNSAHTYRLMQTIGYPYMYEMSVAIYIIARYAGDKAEEFEKALLDRHYKNIEYENEHPPVVYDKKRGLKSFKSKTQKKTKRTVREPRESSASRKLKEHIAKINRLSFKIAAK